MPRRESPAAAKHPGLVMPEFAEAKRPRLVRCQASDDNDDEGDGRTDTPAVVLVAIRGRFGPVGRSACGMDARCHHSGRQALPRWTSALSCGNLSIGPRRPRCTSGHGVRSSGRRPGGPPVRPSNKIDERMKN